jgi:hypothetical protein
MLGLVLGDTCFTLVGNSGQFRTESVFNVVTVKDTSSVGVLRVSALGVESHL